MNFSEIANEIYHHQKKGIELEKITARYPGITLEHAYRIQKQNIEKDISKGDPLIGWKMGLTSAAKQQSVGVSEPIYGRLLKSMIINEGKLPLEGLIHPRVEPELAFLMNKRLEGDQITEQAVWSATEWIMPAIEVIDSRYKDFSFTLIDVVADNASSSKFFISNKRFKPNESQWDKVRVLMKINDKVVQTGKSSAVLGHPVRSVVELVKMLHSSGLCVEPGMVILTGGITEAVHVSSGDFISVEFEQLGTLLIEAM